MRLDLDRSTWKRVRFDEVARHVTDRIDPNNSDVSRYLAGEHLPSRRLQVTNWGVIGDGYLGPAFYKRFRPHHILYLSRRTYLRKIAAPGFSGVCGEKTFVLETLDSATMTREFLATVLSSELFHEYAIKHSRGSVNPYLNWTDLANYEFLLPPAHDQAALSNLFWAADAELVASELLLRSIRTVYRTVLSTRVLVAPGRAVKLADVGEIVGGRQRAPKYATGIDMRPYLRVANIGDGFISFEDVLEMNFSAEEFKRFAVAPGDVLISEGQSRSLVGQAAAFEGAPGKYAFQNTLIRFRSDLSKIAPEYALAAIRALFYSGRFSAIASQTTSIAHLGVNRFSACRIPLPTRAYQVRVVNQLEGIQRAMTAAETAVSQALALRQQTCDGIWR